MSCFYPLTAYRHEDGSVSVKSKGAGGEGRQLSLPCGKCIGCRLEYSRQWAMRCVHEAHMHNSNCFVTLTYNDSNVCTSLDYSDFQKFIRRMRKAGLRTRYFVSGEYGEATYRPHFHALLFGLDFPDRTPWRVSDQGFNLYRSEVLEKYWTFGHCEIGDVTFDSAAYVARYVMKKVTGDPAEDHYKRCDIYTGEIVQIEPEMAHCSKGIGKSFFQKYRSEIYPNDYVVVNGMKVKPPRYYDKLLKQSFDFESDEVECSRYLKGRERMDDSTPERLAVREQVVRGRLSFKKRGLK